MKCWQCVCDQTATMVRTHLVLSLPQQNLLTVCLLRALYPNNYNAKRFSYLLNCNSWHIKKNILNLMLYSLLK